MTAGCPTTVRDPQQRFDSLAEVMRHLKVDMGVTVVYAPLPEHKVFEFYDDDPRVVLLRDTATLHQQLYGLRQIWWILEFGEWAAPAVRRQRRLYLVPPPREATA